MRLVMETPKTRRAKADHPGEPLYTKEEIADRLGVSLSAFVHRLTHPGGEPLRVWTSGQRFMHHKNLYRLSDAKKWWAAQVRDDPALP